MFAYSVCPKRLIVILLINCFQRFLMPLALRIHRNRTVCVMVLIWLLSVVGLSSKHVRGIVALPLFIDEEPVRSEYAYVMADGHAYW